ncbi:Interleukin-1 family member 10 [Myotis brandtii]|uniref:Interleukin-1 n=1 Tax=Myotis brandtii TaxID=109478 RepID=S7P733_MYOBR|nr:Interleukin-1 family member 10 [Myotis brandtii]
MGAPEFTCSEEKNPRYLVCNQIVGLGLSGAISIAICSRIKDADQKALYIRGDQLLVGDPDADNCCAEKICILPNRGLDRTQLPIFLGIQGGRRCLACVETGEGPALKLEDVSIEDLYKGGEQATRFTFFQRSLGSAFRLEAAAWPGWFLCGPAEPQQPVRLAEETEPSARTEFYFEQSR